VSPRDVCALLDRLGSTPDEVAAALLAGGYRGRRDDTCECPVAQYLHASGATDATVEPDEVYLEGEGERVSPPESVRDFIVAFDAGHYPALVTEPGKP
jgi:hypothetical protein